MNRSEGETDVLFREVHIVLLTTAITHHLWYSREKVQGQKTCQYFDTEYAFLCKT